MAQQMLNMRHVDVSSDQLLTSVFQEVKDILNTQLHLHETMMRTSDLYNATYTEMLEQMKSLGEKLPSISPALMTLLLDYSKLAATSTDGNGVKRKQQSLDFTVPMTKKSRKVKEQPLTKRSKPTKNQSDQAMKPSKLAATSADGNAEKRNQQSPDATLLKAKKSRKVKDNTLANRSKPSQKQSNQAIKPSEAVGDTESSACAPPSHPIEPVSPPTEHSICDWLPTSPTLDDMWLGYTQLLDDIEQQEKQDIESDSPSDSAADPYEEKKLTPLQQNCSICRHNNMLRYISCHSGQVMCHMCCMDLMNCLCYYDSERMMEDQVSQDFAGHILTV